MRMTPKITHFHIKSVLLQVSNTFTTNEESTHTETPVVVGCESKYRRHCSYQHMLHDAISTFSITTRAGSIFSFPRVRVLPSGTSSTVATF